MNNLEEELLEEMIKIANSINNLLNKLSELEINGLKNSDIYEKHLEYLKIAIEVETNFYQNSKLTPEISRNILTNLTNNKPNNSLIINLDEDNIVEKRIIRCLNDKLDSLDQEILLNIATNTLADDFIEKVTNSNLDTNIYENFVLNKYFKNALVYDLIEKISNNTLSTIIYENFVFTKYFKNYLLEIFYNMINDSNNQEFKTNLIKYKYQLCNLSSLLEDKLINEKFNKTIIITPKWLLLITTVDEEFYNVFKTIIPNEYVNSIILELLDVEEITLNTLLSYYLLRSCFVLLDEKKLEELNENFHALIDNENFSSKGENLIINAFLNIKNDIINYEGFSLNKKMVK